MHLADSSGGSAALGIIIWIILIAAYWSPTITGAIMHKHNLGVVAVWNFFGWFFLFPFIVAWVKVAEKPQQPVVIMPPPGYYYGGPGGYQPAAPPLQPQYPQPPAGRIDQDPTTPQQYPQEYP